MQIPSTVLVALQFIFIFLLAMPLNAFFPESLSSSLALALLLGGILLALWAAIYLRVKNFSVMPEPVSHGTLICTGPYALIRHPMYSAVLMCAIGALLAHGQWHRVVYVVILAAVLYMKIQREEAMLGQVYADYASYQKRTSAIIPYIY